MSTAEDLTHEEEENRLIDRETLVLYMKRILARDDDAADALASLLVELRQGLESGLEGIVRVRRTLLEAVGLAYVHTRAHGAAVELYRLSQEGQLKVQDEPLRLINAAIGRSTAGARR